MELFFYTLNYNLFTNEAFLLIAFETSSLSVLLTMSGRQGAGGFSITCNATREEKVTKKDS